MALQVKDFTFAHIGRAEGMGSQRIFSISQTENGAIWWSSMTDIGRYNGSKVRNYRLDENTPYSHLGGRVINLAAKAGGSIYAFDATRYDPAPAELSWKIGEDEALNTLPDSVAAESSRRVICRSPGGNPMPCWEIRCTGLKGEPVTIYVNAETGRPCKIEL